MSKHPSEQEEIRISNGDVDIQLDNYQSGIIRLGIFEDGPHAFAAIGKMTWPQARQVAYALLHKADWYSSLSEFPEGNRGSGDPENSGPEKGQAAPETETAKRRGL